MKASDVSRSYCPLLSFWETTTQFFQLQREAFSTHMSHWALTISWSETEYWMSAVHRGPVSHGETELWKLITTQWDEWFNRSVARELTSPSGDGLIDKITMELKQGPSTRVSQRTLSFGDTLCESDGSPDSSVGKESTCNAGDPGSIPGSGRSLVCIESDMGSQRVRHDWATSTRKW